jgi:putative ATP-dependent endonuclease of the OLD family
VARIRRLEIRNFRSIRSLDWTPSAGVNCLVGPGDSGKSSILDAIDYCIGARRTLPISDTDFFRLNVDQPILISVTLGDLPRELQNLEGFGDFLRGYDLGTQRVEDEPGLGIDTVLTLRVKVESDLEPVWSLYSERAEAQGLERGLGWKDRRKLVPARIGGYTASNLSWTRGSVLNRLTEEQPDLGVELARAAREARARFGNQAEAQFRETLRKVTETAGSLGVPVGVAAQALLDAHSVSIGDGAISLHDATGVPLRSLGTGSSRLLVAGLQRAAAEAATIALVDEVEYGLEPHRLSRLLDSLGAKSTPPPLQVFMTSHSPVALRELSGNQVFVVRPRADLHDVLEVGAGDDAQSMLRTDPEAFLARSVLVGEGASEIGFARGLDQFWTENGATSFFSLGGAYVDSCGSNPDKAYQCGAPLLRLGYRVLVFVDSDRDPTAAVVEAHRAAGGAEVRWRAGRALEDELFLSLSNNAVVALVAKAIEFRGRDMVASHVLSHSNGARVLDDMEREGREEGFSAASRQLLATASKSKGNGWFKSISKYELVARDVVGPNLATADADFRGIIERLRTWIHAT